MSARPPFGNRILDSLPRDEASAIGQLLDESVVKQGTIIYRSGGDLQRVYFPISCALSAVTLMKDGTGVEIGSIGNEGMGGVQASLGVLRVPNEMVCQIEGSSFHAEVGEFRDVLPSLPLFQRLLALYTQATLNFMAQSVACNRLHSLNERCARWLLMTRDRVGGNAFYLTQEFLAYMLGVRRSGVTVAASTLQEAGMIEYKRGNITILDVDALESVSCECYRIVLDEFDRLLPQPSIGERRRVKKRRESY
jgi:CRP-like cAMP-binding protein